MSRMLLGVRTGSLGERTITYGTVFREDRAGGTYYSFDPEIGVKVVRCWPKPRAWKLEPGQPWKGFHPPIEIPSSRSLPRLLEKVQQRLDTLQNGERANNLPSLLRQRAMYRLLLTIPEQVRHVIRRHPSGHWNLLRLVAATGNPGMDLLKSTPALGAALANSSRFHFVRRPIRAWRALLGPGRSQFEIAAWLGFPEARSTINMLRKLDAKSMDPYALRFVREIINNEHLRKRAAHLQRLSRPCVFILSCSAIEPLAGQGLLHELADNPVYGVGRAMMDTLRMLAILELEGRRIGPFRSVNQVIELHDSLVDQVNAKTFPEVTFPPPPVPGSDDIQYIKNSPELRAEGLEMHHCVSSYLARIRCGSYAVYRVLAPERCTLGLRRSPVSPTHWIVDDLRGARNQRVSDATHEKVKHWFSMSHLLTSGSDSGKGTHEDLYFEDTLPF